MVLNSLLVIIVNLLNLLLISWLRQHKWLGQCAARKLLHVTSALGAIWATTLLNQLSYVILCILFIAVYWLLKQRRALASLEVPHTKNYGEPLFPLGLAVMGALVWSQPQQHIVGILILGLCDSLGAVLQEYSRNPLGISQQNMKRIGYFVLSYVLLLFAVEPVAALILATLLTYVEEISRYGTDNTTVPAVYSLSILFLNLVQSS